MSSAAGPDQKSRLLKEYADAFAEGRPPDLTGADLAAWAKAADHLVEQGQLELAEHAVRRLNQVYPDFPWARNLCALFDRMPSAAEGQLSFADDFPKDLQIVSREGARLAILVFCGVKHRLGMPLPMAHRWLGRLPASLVYMRDLRAMNYMAGVAGVGPDRDATVEGLRRIIDDLGADKVVCYGNSSGGYAALHYGLAVGAQAAVCMSAPFNLDPDFNTHLRQAKSAGQLAEAFPGQSFDLRRMFTSSARPPRAFIAFGEHHWDDRLHAEHMGGLPGVTLLPVAGYAGHNTAVELIRLGEFDGLLERAANGDG